MRDTGRNIRYKNVYKGDRKGRHKVHKDRAKQKCRHICIHDGPQVKKNSQRINRQDLDSDGATDTIGRHNS